MIIKVIDWNALEAKAKSMKTVELIHAIKDCTEAEKASKGWNPAGEGYYADERSVYAKELHHIVKHNYQDAL